MREALYTSNAYAGFTLGTKITLCAPKLHDCALCAYGAACRRWSYVYRSCTEHTHATRPGHHGEPASVESLRAQHG